MSGGFQVPGFQRPGFQSTAAVITLESDARYVATREASRYTAQARRDFEQSDSARNYEAKK